MAKYYEDDASQLNNKPVEDEENKEDQVEKILAEVHEILSKYGYKYKAPF